MTIWYRMLLLACQAGQTTPLALSGALKTKRITAAEHAELSAILDAALNPPAPDPDPEPEPTPEPAGEDGAEVPA